jgi:hypothetical protein
MALTALLRRGRPTVADWTAAAGPNTVSLMVPIRNGSAATGHAPDHTDPLCLDCCRIELIV